MYYTVIHHPFASCSVHMPATEFQRIMKDLSTIGDTVVISVTKDGVKFSTAGDIGSANVTVRQNTAVDKQVCIQPPDSSPLAPHFYTACHREHQEVRTQFLK